VGAHKLGPPAEYASLQGELCVLLEQPLGGLELARAVRESSDSLRDRRHGLTGHNAVEGPDEVYVMARVLIGEVGAVVRAAGLAPLERRLERCPGPWSARRQVSRPQFTPGDRLLLAALSRVLPVARGGAFW
jgi:hypothetical protein